ncbi:MAG: hypothetical protein LBC33_00835 [Mycoplasmataceae bacterium]|nr:hypothetical protein [Mycoplasmataceae bacterium]
MRNKQTAKVINSTQENQTGVNNKPAVIKQEIKGNSVDPKSGTKPKSRSSQPPEWFQEFWNRVNNFIQQFTNNQMQLNQVQLTFNQEVREFMVSVNKRLDNLERRLDNIVRLNNLKERSFD